MSKKIKDEFLTLLVTTLLSVILTAVVDIKTTGGILPLIPYCFVILVTNYAFECIHSNKRAIFGGEVRPILAEVFFSSAISIITMCVLISIANMCNFFSHWIVPIICSLSIIIGYCLNYVRFKGKKGVYVLLFTSDRVINEHTSLYQLEALYNKRNIDIVDILIIYGYISFKEFEESKLILSTVDINSLEELLKISGKITEEDLEEAEYLLEQYKETNAFMSKKDFKNYRLEKRILLDRLKGD